MAKIALDPAMYHSTLRVADEIREAAQLGYEYLELPRGDFSSWHRDPTAVAAEPEVKAVKDALTETGVRMQGIHPG